MWQNVSDPRAPQMRSLLSSLLESIRKSASNASHPTDGLDLSLTHERNSMSMANIHYTICPKHPEAHLFEVSCRILNPAAAGQIFRLPAWIPGSYMIREFARHIVSMRAECDERTVTCSKLDKHSWQVEPVPDGRVLMLHYQVYAWDLSVRAAHLDQTHGFFNGSSVFVAVEGQTDHPCTVDIVAPDSAVGRDWRVATTLPAIDASSPAEGSGFGRYRAASYDELIDHPVEMGHFSEHGFDVCGVPHRMVISGRHDCDFERLAADLTRICAWQIRLFGEPAPMDRYLFLTTVVGEGYGGLEHRNSTALIANRADLPYRGMQSMPDGYKAFLGLCSHEYFHAWNIKRIKPAAFVPYLLDRENYTRLLWVFEGFTSYYDDLALVRSGVITVEDYLGLLAKTISAVMRGSGRLRQSVAESSFDAWVKYYRQDENSPNAIVSYYAKGALIALALDLRLRQLTTGTLSLDDLMRALWRQFGQTGIGLGEEEVFDLVAALLDRHEAGKGRALARWLRTAVHGTEDLPLARLFGDFGITLEFESSIRAPSIGVKLAPGGNGEVRLAHVYDGGAAQRGGLSAGDQLIALDGLKVNASNLDAMLARRQGGDRVCLHAFRRDELMSFELTLDPPARDQAALKLKPRATARQLKLQAGWLGD